MASFRATGDTGQSLTLIEELLDKKDGQSEQENAESLHYLDKLASCGVSQLCREPERLKDEHEQLLEKTRSLAFKHYRTFIEAAECSREIYKDFNIIEENLHSLLGSIPEFSTMIETFSKGSQEINARRKQNSMVLSRLTQLLEILEIPQLMDTCVRNSYYEEALELTNYVKRLEKKLSSIKIISDIGKEVKKASRLMLNQLLQQLKGDIQLPACLRIIGYLRQLETFNEPELRIKFLQARDSWFQRVIGAIPNKDAYYHITKVIEASRVHLFDIVTQYRAIFSDDDPIFMMEEDHALNYANILHAWIGRKITDFMSILNRDLEQGVAGRLDSVLSQCMYFGLSFSRVGADFRSLLMPIFNRNVMNTFMRSLAVATKSFEDNLTTYAIAQNLRLQDNKYQGLKTKTSETSLSPPQELLEFPPLAHYTNGILTCFNELRGFASIPLVKLVRDSLQNSLERVSVATCSWARLESQTPSEKDKKYIIFFTTFVVEEFFPYIIRCFHAVFKPSAISVVYGRRSLASDPQQSSNDLYMIDIEAIHGRLVDFLPEKIAVDQGVEMEFKNQGEEEEMIKDGKINPLDGLAKERTQEENPASILKSIGDMSLDELNQRKSGTSPLSQTNNSKQIDEIDKANIDVKSEGTSDAAKTAYLQGT
eukprot:Seg2816.3 transcript_id=Seg2816.3/GoldUCD/mRNA.D3Y31 product="Conserved oligomeric Golgi complex subunit 8" protein_id=Seg2816.3/GoldUCD/D3Y31